MWILEWLPAFMVHITIVASILALIFTSVISIFPIVDKYAKPIQIIAVLLLVACFWLEGGLAVEAKYKQKIAEDDLKIQKLQTTSGQVTVKTVIQYVDREKKIYVKGQTINKEVIKYVDRIDSTNCVIPNEAIRITDQSADKEWKPKE